MQALQLGPDRSQLHVVCLGAHSDDVEIGCAGTLLRWLQDYEQVHVTWVVLSATGPRSTEARRSARALLRGAGSLELVLGDFQDAHFPGDFARIKAFLSGVAQRVQADVVLTHNLDDRHQDHRLVAELTWQTWRNHFIAEYEIPKYEGDLGRPNLFVPLAAKVAERKVRHLMTHFASQRSKDWFTPATFRGLMAVRGIECRAPSGMAEAFQVRKAVL